MISLMLFVFISMLAGIVLKLLLKRTFVPYTVGLFLVGLLVGVVARFNLLQVPHETHAVLTSIANMDPEHILYLFLPVLIFEASLNMNVHVFRKTFINASILAIPGLIIALLLTAALLMVIGLFFPHYAQWTWTIALMFGALISATDPVAVVALLKELRVNKRFSTLVDAESMLNDGTGIVFFMLFLGTFTSHTGLNHGPVINFLITVLGAAIAGAIVGGTTLWIAAHVKTEPVLQSCLMIISSYILFYFSNSVLEVSGVIALVAFGLVIAHDGPARLRPKVNQFIREFWELAAYIANTLIFIVVGIMIALKCDFTWSNFGILLLVYIGLNVIRALMIFLFYPIMRKVSYGITFKEVLVLSWGGLRGAVSLTLALLVFYTFDIPEVARGQILFLTGGVVTLTLLLNATTMGWLLKTLKLTCTPSAKRLLEYNAKISYQDKARDYFKSLKKEHSLKEGVDWEKLEAYLPKEDHYLSSTSVSSSSLATTIRRRVLEHSLTYSHILYQEGSISTYTLKRLSSLVEEQNDFDGELPLSHLQTSFAGTYSALPPWKRQLMAWSYHVASFLRKRAMNYYDFLRGFLVVQHEAIKAAEELADSLQLLDKEIVCSIIQEIESNIRAAEVESDLFAENFLIAYRMAVNDKARRMLLRKERDLIKELAQVGMLDDEEEVAMLEEVGKKRR